ncbi:MAG TPA: sensor histidine kinase, partial [Pseudolabrys sp.]|nr:sensor histidine kinase [Pseudolabrys sp.]
RLHALARAHSLLIDAQWQSAELKPLVEQATDAYRVDHPRRIEVEGPPVTLSARKSLSLTLILHELGTNAAKYGALSRHEGRLCITWTVERDSESECVRLIWQERDGPEVESPQRRGFGSKLIDRAVESGLNGKAEIDYARPGLACAITFPVP